MDSVLVTRLDAEGATLERQRTWDERIAYWSLVEEWMADNDTASVKVERFDSTDTCLACYIVTPDE